jgi:hypothetical protein
VRTTRIGAKPTAGDALTDTLGLASGTSSVETTGVIPIARIPAPTAGSDRRSRLDGTLMAHSREVAAGSILAGLVPTPVQK